MKMNADLMVYILEIIFNRDSIMCDYFCIKFIDYMFDDKTLIDYTNLFSPHDFKKNDIIINQKI